MLHLIAETIRSVINYRHDKTCYIAKGTPGMHTHIYKLIYHFSLSVNYGQHQEAITNRHNTV